ncbi:MAG: hypothetical protein FD174_1549 [Geobacteraceae bacterium]|nr:MAG: hypothetical protein FD174_1549 [Geobacteraceae bacterium]
MTRKIGSMFGAVATLALATLFGCGGGNGGNGTTAGPVTISGVAAKGPINGGDIKVYAVRDDQFDRSVVLGSGKTAADGSYAVALASAPTGPVVVEVSGGTFTDEASGTAGVALKTPLLAVVPSVADGDRIAVTPLTHLAFEQVEGIGAFTTVNIDDSNTQIARFFALSDIVGTLPFDPTQPAPAGATNDQKKYAAILGVFSQMVNDDRQKRGNTQSLDDALVTLLVALETELENNGGFSQAVLNSINTAITNFNNSGRNRGGIVPVSIAFTGGVLQLRTEGTLPAGTVINGIDCTVTLPAGVTVKSDPATGQTPPGVVDPVSLAAANSVVSARFDKAAGTLRIILINVQPGFAIGEFAHVEFDGFPTGAAAFAVKVNRIDGGSGGTSSAPLTGITIKGAFAGL